MTETENTSQTGQSDTNSSPAHTVPIFTDVAPKYEFLNSLMTAGQDRIWRQAMLSFAETALGRSPTVTLDLATGTGDVARMMAKRWPKAKVIGTDPTDAMLDEARKNSLKKISTDPEYQHIHWQNGLAEEINLPDASVDVVTIAFGYRNVSDENKSAARAEALRVLKPGGVFAILELGLPADGVKRRMYRFLLRNAMPRFAGIFGPKSAYDYLARSILEFPEPGRVKHDLETAGFSALTPRALSMGMAWLYLAKKPLH